MGGLGTPSKPDLHLQSATVTKFFILPKHMPTWSTNASSVDVDSAVICLTTSCPYFILTTLATQSCAPKVKWGKKIIIILKLFWIAKHEVVVGPYLLESVRRLQGALQNPGLSRRWAGHKGHFVLSPLQTHNGSPRLSSWDKVFFG